MPRCNAKPALNFSVVATEMNVCSDGSTCDLSPIAEHHAESQRGRAAGSPEKEMIIVFLMAIATPSAISMVTASGASTTGVGAIETTLRRSK